ncbi:hypothetical protein MCOR27_010142 [Pyricularia oryzae]|nr:hypothetical protein MCOR02_000178 [Pyricularia oryzae]KAI6256409.1 hypothetical protein MCOR19_007128 [Pyricularia oryzae]KAI6268466.1 hypothetical protein MCOR27_010142 [Pyricularia oryzae]KAI6290401.1 hypothetical protein MCOR34_010424 [Pyricularia oryzae]KAI6305491.1 hypothetical protein MCOR29_010450 [Pyricularia oryzae]
MTVGDLGRKASDAEDAGKKRLKMQVWKEYGVLLPSGNGRQLASRLKAQKCAACSMLDDWGSLKVAAMDGAASVLPSTWGLCIVGPHKRGFLNFRHNRGPANS